MIIENLKRLAKKSFYVTINIDADEVEVKTDGGRWQGKLDELEEYLNNQACFSNTYIDQEIGLLSEIFADCSVEDIRMAGMCYMKRNFAGWPIANVYWNPENNVAKAGALFTIAAAKSSDPVLYVLIRKCVEQLEASVR